MKSTLHFLQMFLSGRFTTNHIYLMPYYITNTIDMDKSINVNSRIDKSLVQ